MVAKEHFPVIISGPSGSGKTTLVNYIQNENSDFIEATGCTTREKREEKEEIIFLSISEFKKMIDSNAFIEYCEYNGNYYGTPKSEFKKLDEKFLIFNVSFSGAQRIKTFDGRTLLVYLLPPNQEELIRRLGNRGMERYWLGVDETIKHGCDYDYLLISQTDDYLTTYADFMDIVEKKEASKVKSLVRKKNKDFVRRYYN